MQVRWSLAHCGSLVRRTSELYDYATGGLEVLVETHNLAELGSHRLGAEGIEGQHTTTTFEVGCRPVGGLHEESRFNPHF